MPRIIEIDDASDQRLSSYANLRGDQHRGEDAESYIVEGRRCVERLSDSRHEILSVLFERGKQADLAESLPDETIVYSLPSQQVSQLVGYDFHRGVLACARRPALHSIDQLSLLSPPPAVVLAMLGVTELENVGSMIRTAAALGVHHLLIGPKTADPFARRTVRVSMGTIFHQQLYSLDRPQEQLNEIRESGNYRTVATTLDPDATPLNQFVADERPIILLMGCEDSGLEPEIQAEASDRVSIPMQPGIDSLNVAVAAAIFLYQLTESR